MKRDPDTGHLSGDVSKRDCRIQLYYKEQHNESDWKGKYVTTVVRPAEYVLRLGYMDEEHPDTPQHKREYQLPDLHKPNLIQKVIVPDCYFIPTYMIQPVHPVAGDAAGEETADRMRSTCVLAVGKDRGKVTRLIYLSFATLDGRFPPLDYYYSCAY